MSIVISDYGLLYGIVTDKPTLPSAEWKFIEGIKSWLLAESPDGKKYYVANDKLFSQGKDSNGSYFLDGREVINIK